MQTVSGSSNSGLSDYRIINPYAIDFQVSNLEEQQTIYRFSRCPNAAICCQ